MSMHQHLSRHLVRASNGQTAETKSPQRTTASRKATVMWAALAAGFLAVAIPHVAQAAVSENFDSIFGTSYTDQTASGWRINSGLRSATARSGSCARLASTGANNYLQYQGSDGNGKDGGVGNISFWYRAWDQSPQPKFKVQYSVNGGSFSDIGSEISPTTTYTLWSNDLNNASDNIIIRIQQTAGERMLFDDAYIGDYASASPPTVTTLGESSVAASSAVLGGNVTADGGDTVTNRGVCYKTSASVTISDNKTQIGSGTGAFSNTVGSLSVNVHYYFRAYAQNSAGTSLGSESNFWTLANVPSAPTVNNPTSSSLDVAVNENSNPSSTEFAIKVTYGAITKYVQSDGTLGDSEAWATDSTWGTKTVTGLSSSTEYTFSVAARNGANVATAYSSTASGTTSASGCSERWTCLDNLGAPVYTYYLGDSLAYIYYYELNTDTSGWTSDYGLGTTTDGSGWTWRSATYDSNNGTNWKWKNNASEHQFTSVGNWYYAGRFVNGSCTYYADATWQATSAKALDATNYFTVSALNNPGSQTATAAGATNISLSWAKDAQSHDVMIVRSTDSSFTDPTGGTAYTAGTDTIGGDLVVYRGGATSFMDTNLSANTTYYYKFYSENWSYYSAGVTADATTWTLPTVSTTSATPGTPADPTQANATGNVTAEGGQSVTERAASFGIQPVHRRPPTPRWRMPAAVRARSP